MSITDANGPSDRMDARPDSQSRLVLLALAIAWAGALAYSTLAGRSLFADGAHYVLVNLQAPHRFNDYDSQRTFASFISQAPVLLGQRLGLESVSAYAALYSVGMFVLPAIAMLAALYIARATPPLFAGVATAITIYGFGVNFINTEANILFGFTLLAVAILAMRETAPLLRGLLLPLIAVALLRTYEGMLLVGPLLCAWAFVASREPHSESDRPALVITAILFALGAAIGLGGLLSPRDPANAMDFLSSAVQYLRNPHGFLFAAALLAFAAAFTPVRSMRFAILAALSFLAGLAYLIAMTRLSGYFAYSIYYQNRSFLALSLPVFVALGLAAVVLRPHWLRMDTPSVAVVLVPVAFAICGDIQGTVRWRDYVRQFCAVLKAQVEPAQRLAQLRGSDVRTGWAWTHPTLSLLLRSGESRAMVVNDPGQYEPFDHRNPKPVKYTGVCAVKTATAAAPPSVFDTPISFTGDGKYPPYLAQVRGLSFPEKWATWSEGKTVELELRRPLPKAFDLKIELAGAFGANQKLPVIVQAGAVQHYFVVSGAPFETTLSFDGVGQADTLTFIIPQPQSPAEAGAGTDARKLGIAFKSLTIVPR